MKLSKRVRGHWVFYTNNTGSSPFGTCAHFYSNKFEEGIVSGDGKLWLRLI